MDMELSSATLRALWPHATAATISGVCANSGVLLAKYGIATIPELVDFMAECSEETGGGIAFVESGAYTAARAHEVWPSLFPTVQSAEEVVGNPKALFDRTYGGRLGNRPGTDDGYDFRGRGLIQITGRSWYEEIAKAIALPIDVTPDLVADPKYLLECALGFWKLDGVNKYVGDLRAEVKRINGGYTNMAIRESWEAIATKLITAESVKPLDRQAVGQGPIAVVTQARHEGALQEIAAVLKRWL